MGKYYRQAVEEASLNGIEIYGDFPKSAIDVIDFLQENIEGYRKTIKENENKIMELKEKLEAAEAAESTLAAMRETGKSGLVDVIKALTDSGFTQITLNAYKE